MTTYNLDILIRAIDKATGPMRDVGGGLKGLAQEADSAARSLQPLGTGLSALSAGGGALIAVSAMTAARVEVLGTVLYQVGQHANYTTAELDAFEAGLMEAGITVGASRQGLIQMMQAEIELASATDLARLAQDAAVIANINSSDAYERLITGIQRGEPILLRTMGITVDFQGAYVRLAEQLGITTAELSAEQKMQARVNEVMQQGEAISGVYEAAMGDVGKKLGSVKGDLQDAANALGKAYLPAMEAGIDATRDALEWFTALDEGTQKNIATFLGLGTAVTGVTGATILLLPKVIAVGQSIGTLATFASNTGFALKLLAVGSNTAGLGLAGVTASALTVIAPLAALVGVILAANAALEGHHEKTVALSDDYEQYIDMLRRTGRAAIAMSEAEWETARGAKKAEAKLGDLTHEMWRLQGRTQKTTPEMEEIATAMRNTAAASVDLKGQMGILNAALTGPIAQANEKYEESQGDIYKRIVEVREELEKYERQHGRMVGSQDELTIAQYKAQEATTGLAEAQQALADNTDPEAQLALHAAVAGAAVGLDKANAAMGRAGPHLTNYSEKIGELEGELGGLERELGELEAEHDRAMKEIVYDLLAAQIATKDWGAAGVDLQLALARDFGLIDEKTWAMATSINESMAAVDSAPSQEEMLAIAAKAEEASERAGIALGAIPDEIEVRLMEEGFDETVAFVKDELLPTLADIPRSITTTHTFMTRGGPERAGLIEGPGFQHGLSYVPETAYYLLHPGEAVVPAGEVRGGDSYDQRTEMNLHIHTSAPVESIMQDFELMRAMAGA